ncbi:MAG TPA: hypothetical protein VHK88_10100 [Aquihabitans sp.]|jgi:hypothetical protein|nr:hypothetical protein [Aquihabitans sp.]
MRPTPAHRLLTAAALALLLTAGLGACGGDDDDAAPTTTEAASTTAADAGEGTSEEDTEDGDTTTTASEEDGDETSTTEGGGSGSADRQAYVDALTAALTSDGEGLFEPAQMACLGEAFVDTIGVEELQAADISPEQFAEQDGESLEPLGLTEDDANELYDQYATCEIDLQSAFNTFLTSDGQVTPEQQACVDRYATDDSFRRSFVADILGEELADDPLEKAGECVGF